MSSICVAIAVPLAFIVGDSRLTAAEGQVPPLRITTMREDDKVEVRAEDGNAMLSIHSPFGISGVEIERVGPQWPTVVTLRLHLRGLEHFKIANGEVALKGAISSHGVEHATRLWLNDAEDSPLNDESPLWMEVHMFGDDGKPVRRIPLDAGYFEMRLPKSLFEGNPSSIKVSWIDFYR